MRELAVAASDGQSHPVIGLWSVALREQLRHALVVEDIRKIDRWTARYRLATVDMAGRRRSIRSSTPTPWTTSPRPSGWRRWMGVDSEDFDHDHHADLNGHVALVTGGSRGIGAAIAMALAEAGAAVAVNYLERAD